MSPQSGSAGSLVSPKKPKPPKAAVTADPGEVDEVESPGLDEHKPDDEKNKKKTSWIEIEMVYESNGKPVPGLYFEITLPDGETMASGTLNEKGCARVERIDPGTCKVSFPDLDKEAWEDA